jgi:hypothetical protein
METSINFGKNQYTFKFLDKTLFYRLNADLQHQEITEYAFHQEFEKFGNYLDLTSDAKKIFISMPNSIYHFFIDYAGKILKQASIDRNLELVVPDYTLKSSFFGGKVYRDTLDLFESLGIKVRIVDTDKYDGIIVNNVYVSPAYSVQQNYENSLYEAALNLVEDKNVAPFRKVFLSRKNMGDRQHSVNSDLPVKHDNRIDSHDKIENYFRTLGYEIITPEHFSSLKEQVTFFYQTKIIVSTTSSGLVNSAFMREGQTMVELQTPLIVHMPKQDQMGVPTNGVFDFSNMVAVEQLHFFYIKMAFQKKHKYLAINNLTRESNQIIKTIENDKYLKGLLVGEELEEAPQPRKRRWLKR